MKKIIYILLVIFVFSCQKQSKTTDKQPNAAILHQLEKKLTDIIVVDIFSPPVASRIYANCSLAMYEAARHAQTNSVSLTNQMNGFETMPEPEKGKVYDFSAAAIQAFCETAKKITFSAPEIEKYQQESLEKLELDAEILKNSIEFGQKVAAVVIKRLGQDNYKETRGMERFEVNTEALGRWLPTAPDYADGLEPHWAKMKTLILDSASQCRPLGFSTFSRDKSSPFYKEMMEVYDISKHISPEQENITIFWDDNPFVSKHIGHVMFQDKKMTPGGHWMAICRTACQIKKADFVKTAQMYALTSTALYEAFISCWEEKYRSVRIRPQTAIQQLIDEQWISYLQTPPFPEYTSGHSTISAAAAEILTAHFGDNFAYTDSTEIEYALPVRSFKSFREAAEEASISRVYGGIHFRSGCQNGNQQGKKVAEVILKKLKL